MNLCFPGIVKFLSVKPWLFFLFSGVLATVTFPLRCALIPGILKFSFPSAFHLLGCSSPFDTLNLNFGIVVPFPKSPPSFPPTFKPEILYLPSAFLFSVSLSFEFLISFIVLGFS